MKETTLLIKNNRLSEYIFWTDYYFVELTNTFTLVTYSVNLMPLIIRKKIHRNIWPALMHLRRIINNPIVILRNFYLIFFLFIFLGQTHFNLYFHMWIKKINNHFPHRTLRINDSSESIKITSKAFSSH